MLIVILKSPRPSRRDRLLHTSTYRPTRAFCRSANLEAERENRRWALVFRKAGIPCDVDVLMYYCKAPFAVEQSAALRVGSDPEACREIAQKIRRNVAR